MKMTMSEAHNMYGTLMRIDGDPALKLKDDVREAIIINIARLTPQVQAYEKVRQMRFAEMREEGVNDQGVYVQDEQLFNTRFNLMDMERRDQVDEFPDLKLVKLADLRPTKGDGHIVNRASLRPMIEDWPG